MEINKTIIIFLVLASSMMTFSSWNANGLDNVDKIETVLSYA